MSAKLLTLHATLIAELKREKDKMKGYNNLKRELKKYGMPVKVIPVVVGAFGTTPKKLKTRFSDIGIEKRIAKLQKTTVLYSARILQNVLRFEESC